MRLAILLLALAAGIMPCRAQRALPAPVPTTPEYLYCEIVAEAEPAFAKSAVIFDFGQRTEAWRYNYLTDAEGNAYRFNSGVEALNYMVGRGWEFVQAFVSGKEGATKHYLLRLPLRTLDEATRERLLAEPGTRKGSGRKSSATAGEERNAGDRAR